MSEVRTSLAAPLSPCSFDIIHRVAFVSFAASNFIPCHASSTNMMSYTGSSSKIGPPVIQPEDMGHWSAIETEDHVREMRASICTTASAFLALFKNWLALRLSMSLITGWNYFIRQPGMNTSYSGMMPINASWGLQEIPRNNLLNYISIALLEGIG